MKLFAGPWVGEFGWELMMWQGYIRKMAHKYDEVIVGSREGHEYIYRDFATDFVPVKCGTNTDCERCSGYSYNGIHKKHITKEDRHFPAKRFQPGWRQDGDSLDKQEFVKFGKKIEGIGFDLLIHARSTAKQGTSIRNWPINKWLKLVDMLKGKITIACVGSGLGSLHVEGTEDRRGIPLEELSNIMASSRATVGPSSGPMHLATLCGLTHVVFSPNFNEKRYMNFWNPFKTRCLYIVANNWNPEVHIVHRKIEEALQ